MNEISGCESGVDSLLHNFESRYIYIVNTFLRPSTHFLVLGKWALVQCVLYTV